MASENSNPSPEFGLDNSISQKDSTTPRDKSPIISSEAIQLLIDTKPPMPDSDNNEDLIEAQIHSLLGDVTLPRSFFPAIEAIAKEQIELEAKALEHRHLERPDELDRLKRLDVDWPGKSPEANQKLIDIKKQKLKQSLIGTREMANFRVEAAELSNRYVSGGISKSETAENYFTRASFDLWKKMSDYTKDYLTYEDRHLTVQIKERDIDEILDEVMAIANGISRVKSKGSVHLENGENQRSYSWNGVEFTFDDDKISSLRLDEGTAREEHSPLLSFVISEKDLKKVENNFSDGTQIGPFNVGVIFHEYGDGEHNIIISINTREWSQDKIRNFLERYIKNLQSEPKSEGQTAKYQLIDAGVISAEVLRI